MMTLHHLKQLATLAPDLPLGQAVPVLEWIGGMLNPAGSLPATRAQLPIEGEGKQMPTSMEGAIVMADPLPAPASEVAASDAGAPKAARKYGDTWTDAEIARAWELKRAGHTASHIARLLGRSTAATAEVFKRQRRLGRAPMPPAQVHRRWTAEELAEALTMKAQGAKYGEIAARFGRSPEATRVALTRPGIEARIASQAARPEDPHADARTDGQAPDATDPADLGRLDECAAGGAGPAPAGDADAAGAADVPGVDPGGIAEGAAQQPAGHGVVSLDVADAPRLEPAPVTGAPEPAWLRDPSLTVRQHDLLQHMSCLSRDEFTPQDDLFLVEELAKGTPGNIIADQLGCDLKLAARRFRSLQTEDIVNAKGILTIDGQADLLVAVRHRARHA